MMRRVRSSGIALGFAAAVGTALVLAPHAYADTQDDAEKAISELQQQISDNEADRGFNDTGLGEESGSVTAVGDGFSQKFEGGTIYWTKDEGAKVLYGAVDAKYIEEGGLTGSLGAPTESEKDGPFDPGRQAEFAAEDEPKIYWTPTNGAWVVRGAFEAALDKLTPATLGAPLADQTESGDELSQRFANGTLTFNKATNTWTTPNPEWTTALSGLSIPGLPDVNAPSADVNAPGVSANVSAPNVDVNAPSVDSDTDSGFNWWWLIIPLLLILAALLIGWLLSKLRKPKVTTPDVRTPTVKGPDVKAPNLKTPDVKAPNVSGKAAGAAAAGAAGVAGAAAAGKALKDRAADKVDDAKGSVTGTGVDIPDVDVHKAAQIGAAGAAAGGVAAGAAGVAKATGDAGTDTAAGAAGLKGSGDGVGTYKLKGVETVVPVGAHLPLEDPAQAPQGYPIKGNADSGLYHVPGQSSYEQTIPEIWFATEAAAEAGGFTKANVT